MGFDGKVGRGEILLPGMWSFHFADFRGNRHGVRRLLRVCLFYTGLTVLNQCSQQGSRPHMTEADHE
jgi:hypothetical protein